MDINTIKMAAKKCNRGRYSIRGVREGRTKEVSNWLEDLEELCRGGDKGNEQEQATFRKRGKYLKIDGVLKNGDMGRTQ